MGEHDDEVNRELLDFGREFDIDLGSIYADGVSEAFSEAIAVQLDTTAFDFMVLTFLTMYASKYGISIIAFLFNLLNKLNVCFPRSSVVIGPYDERTGRLAANPPIDTALILWICGLGESGSGKTYAKDAVNQNFHAAVGEKGMATPAPLKNGRFALAQHCSCLSI